MNSRPFAVLISCAMTLAGCAGGTDVRALEPQTSETIAMPVDHLSACVYYKLLSNSHVSHIDKTRDGNIVHVTGGIDGGGYYTFNWDVSFVPVEPQHTRVEVRSKNTVWSGDIAPKDVAVSIEDCRQ